MRQKYCLCPVASFSLKIRNYTFPLCEQFKDFRKSTATDKVQTLHIMHYLYVILSHYPGLWILNTVLQGFCCVVGMCRVIIGSCHFLNEAGNPVSWI